MEPPPPAHLGCNSARHEALRVQAHSCLTGCTRVMALVSYSHHQAKEGIDWEEQEPDRPLGQRREEASVF